ncbi:EpsG family protein [Fusobacterium ulcerans]|uniref:EpsG family protein n=1 Tax=Fusobacterium ulcerans TaxID=861 RepID=UPI001D0A73D5|nr:EpsG family protein [Fusobacterium ulcerans]MCB8564935.1 EpsG family protein [Fusobacterium ulcerans]MCB8650366.1 EpsG family protein [Fusobacterium ulcerans]
MLKVLNVLFYLFYMFLLFFFATLKKTKNNKRFLKIFVILMLFFFFIKELGLDYRVYQSWYYDLNILNKYRMFKEHVEPIPYFFMLTLRKLNLSHRFFFLIMGGIPLLINFYIINKLKYNRLLALFFLFYINFFTGFSDAIRQNIAAAFLLLSIYLYTNNKKIKSLLIMVLSFFSHYSTIFILPILILKKIKWSIRKYILTILIVFICSFFIKTSLNYLEYLNTNNILLWKLKYYLLTVKTRYEYNNFLHYILLKAMILFNCFGVVLLNIILLKRKNIFEKILKLILEISIVSSIFSLFFLFIGAETIGARISLTFSYGLYLLIPNTFIDKKERAIILIYYFIYNFIVMLYYAGIHDSRSPFYLL